MTETEGRGLAERLHASPRLTHGPVALSVARSPLPALRCPLSVAGYQLRSPVTGSESVPGSRFPVSVTDIGYGNGFGCPVPLPVAGYGIGYRIGFGFGYGN